MFVFIILHYLAEDMTKECVEYIEKYMDMIKCRIVIVDNASANDSGKRLEQYYNGKEYCDVILNKENIGFARGNNVGYTYAKEKYNPDYIIIMNNDVLINDDKFLDKIEKIYTETDFHVLGPDILSKLTGKHQNPFRKNGATKKEIEKAIKEFEKFVKHPFISYILNKIRSKIAIRTRIKKLMRKDNECKLYMERLNNPVLHGACYIFSKKYIICENEAFDSRTFLYHEEDILHRKCMNKKYSMVYDPSIMVTHLEDVSTNAALSFTKKSWKDEVRKYKFLLENNLESNKILLDVMNE